MTEDQRNGRMRTVGSVAAALVLRLLLDEAKKSRPVMTPNGGAGAAKDCGADTQGGKCAGSAERESITAAFRDGPKGAAISDTRPARGLRI